MEKHPHSHRPTNVIDIRTSIRAGQLERDAAADQLQTIGHAAVHTLIDCVARNVDDPTAIASALIDVFVEVSRLLAQEHGLPPDVLSAAVGHAAALRR
jgi:hypothetical protein